MSRSVIFNAFRSKLRSPGSLSRRSVVKLRFLDDFTNNSKGKLESIGSRRFQHSPPSVNYNGKNWTWTELTFKHADNGIATLSFNRPKAANALGRTMLSQLQNAVSILSGEEGKHIRCVVLTSCSPRVFSAGADLRERSTMSMEEAAAFVTELRNTLDSIASLPMPLIACVEGAAFGGGLEIALTADMIVAGSDARFGLPETSLAIIPGAGGTQRLQRLIGTARAKELIFTARKINASVAYDYGIVQHVVDTGAAEEKCLSIAREISQNGPLAIRAAKKAILLGKEVPIQEGMNIERSCYQSIIPTCDRLEGLAAFREKRKPNYKGE